MGIRTVFRPAALIALKSDSVIHVFQWLARREQALDEYWPKVYSSTTRESPAALRERGGGEREEGSSAQCYLVSLLLRIYSLEQAGGDKRLSDQPSTNIDPPDFSAAKVESLLESVEGGAVGGFCSTGKGVARSVAKGECTRGSSSRYEG